MATLDTFYKKNLTLWFLLALPLAALLCFTGWWFDKSITAENHLLENTKAVLLFIAVIFHIYRSRTLPEHQPIDTWVRIALAFLCLGFFLRELDIDKFGDPAIWSVIERSLRGVAIAGLLIWYGYLLTKITTFWQLKFRLIAEPIIQLSFI